MDLALSQQRTAGPIRREELFGRNHYVVPAVAVQEMVLENNIGSMYLPAEEIEASVNAWDFTPVTLGHPTRRGQPTSARDPDVVNSRAVGIVFNSRFEDGALKVDVFIDPDQARNVAGGEEVLAQLQSGEVGEVSTGFAFRAENRSGEFDGDEFDLIARNIQPDHFAVGIEKGACSVEDGCGLGVNHDGPCEEDEMEKADAESVEADEVAEGIWAHLKALITNQESTMDQEQIEQLSEATGLDEEAINGMEAEDREALAANVLSDDSEEESGEEEEQATNATPEDAPEWASNLIDEVTSLREDVDEVREAAEPAVNEYREEQERLVSRLANNDRCPFGENELEEKGLEELRKLDQMAKNRDYGGRGGPRASELGDDIDLDFDVGSPWDEPAEA